MVSRIGLGCEVLGGADWGPVDADLALRAVPASLEHGINLFETADVYGLGRSEELLSIALGSYRNRVAIASKFGLRGELIPGETRARITRDCSARWVMAAVEQSLRRLKLESIPIYIVHWPDPATPIAETIAALDGCRRAGKIRCIGVSNFSASEIREAHQVTALDVVEVPYSLLDRRCETEILPLCQELNIRVLAYGPLGQGLLTGKYGPAHQFESNDRRGRLPQFRGDLFPENFQIVHRLHEIGLQYEISPSQLAIRWVLDHPGVSAVIVGAKSPGHVKENAGALGFTLASSDYHYLANGQRGPAASEQQSSYASSIT
ncbi:MAG: aldo/keto reductase [Acidobacteriaceae bacterium]|nr:aldo/keto reductase [Acidobacteriaceae bacterium]MBV9296560.1 aldo/keto reductase [Acidobacteriaceae bacterium]MBV9765044.1 aldo/keto reductase [Acidobacteriaceae bacterium]